MHKIPVCQGSNVRDGLSNTAIAQFLGTYNPSGTSRDDRVSEVALLENLFGPIEAVGINVGTSALDILNQVEGVASNVVPDAATNITTAEQLDQVLADLNPEIQFSPAGRGDTINGGEGSDILFGDAPFTDDLAADVAGLGTADGGGWQVFTELEADKGQGSYAGGIAVTPWITSTVIWMSCLKSRVVWPEPIFSMAVRATTICSVRKAMTN